LKVGSMSDYDS